MATKEEVAVAQPEPESVTSELDAMGLNEDGSPKDPAPVSTTTDVPGGKKPDAPAAKDETDEHGKRVEDMTPEEKKAYDKYRGERHRSSQARINAAVKAASEKTRRAVAEADTAKAALEEQRKINAQLIAAGGKPPEAATAAEPAKKPDVAAEKPPKYEDFDTLDEFLEARDAFKDKQRAAAAPEKKSDEPAAPDKPDEIPITPERKMRLERFGIIEEKAKTDAAYKKAVFNDLTITTLMADSIFDQDNFEEVIDYFVENPGAAKKVAVLESSGRQDKIAGAIAYIAESLADDDDAAPPAEGDPDFEGDPDPIPDTPDEDKNPPPRKPAVSNAPPPLPRVVRTGSAARVTKSPDDMSQAEYEAWRKNGGGR